MLYVSLDSINVDMLEGDTSLVSPDNCEWEKKCLTTTYMRSVIEIKTTYKHRVKTLEATCNFSFVV